MTRRDFALLVLILLLGAGVTLSQKIRQGVLPFDVRLDGLDLLEGPVRTFRETREESLASARRVEIDAVRGDVEVLTWDEPKVRVEVRKQIRAETEEEAARLAAQLPLVLEPTPGGVTVRVAPSPGSRRPEGLATDFTVTAPRGGGLQILTSHGDVKVHGIRGDVVLRTSHGEVEAGDLGGSCDVANRHGRVRVARVAGNLKILDEHDDVTVSEIGGGVEIETAHGGVSVVDVKGAVAIRAPHGEIHVARAEQSVRVEAPHSTVILEAVGGGITALVEADPLEAREVNGPATVQADVTSVQLIDVRGRIRVEGRHTDVQVIRPGSDVEVRTTHQEIELEPPAGRGFRVQARSERGEIESDLPALQLPEEPVASFAGTFGDGRSRYDLSTSYSTIRIKSPR